MIQPQLTVDKVNKRQVNARLLTDNPWNFNDTDLRLGEIDRYFLAIPLAWRSSHDEAAIVPHGDVCNQRWTWWACAAAWRFRLRHMMILLSM